MDIFEVMYKDKEEQAKYDNVASKITENIYIGNKNTSVMKKYLKEIGITHIVRVGEGLEDHYKKDFDYLSIDIWDNTESNIYPYFEPVIWFIDKCIKNKGKVLVHCYMGKSRSVTLVCCYLMKKENYDTNKALEIIKKHRDIADPNYAFESQLNEFYLKEVIGLIKVPKKYKNRGYSCYNNLKKFSPVKKFKLSTIEDNKSKVKKIRSKKVNVVQNMMENSKVLLIM